MLKTTDSNTNKETGGQDTRSGTEKRCSHNLQSGSKPILASGLFKWQAAFLFRAKDIYTQQLRQSISEVQFRVVECNQGSRWPCFDATLPVVFSKSL